MANLIDLCKKSYPVGLFGVPPEITDESIRMAAETGANFFVSGGSSPLMLELCGKYGLGLISTSNFELWWGGFGDNAGTYENHLPLGKMDEIKKTYPESPALWGDYPVDEPSCKDFLHINKVLKRYMELFPDKLPFINLHPAQACKLKSAEGNVPLGCKLYSEYIDFYVRDIELPYIAFDNYPLTNLNHDFDMYLENLDTVARACKKSGKEMWVIPAAGAFRAEQNPAAFQIDWQTYMCLAYGARAIIHACYSKNWWDESTSCINSKGEKNPTYDHVKDINAVLHSPLGTEFLKYRHIHTEVCGDIGSAHGMMVPQFKRQNWGERPEGTPDIKIDCDKTAVVGYFAKMDGGGFAAMVTNSHNPFEESVTANVELTPKGGEKTIKTNIYGGGKISGSVKNSAAHLTLKSGQGAFVTFEY